MHAPARKPPRRDIVGDQKLRQQCRAHPRQHGVTYHQQRREPKNTLRPDDPLFRRPFLHPPDGTRRRRAQQDGLHHPLIAIHRPPGPGHRRGRHDQPLILEKTSANEAFVRRRVDPDHEIIAILDQIDPAILGNDFKPHLRIGAREPGGDPRKHHMGEHHRRADPQPAPRRGSPQHDGFTGFRDFRQQPMRALVERAPLIRHAQTLRTALDQPDAKALFQFADMAGQRRLGPAGEAPRAPESAMGRHEVEIGQRLQIHRIVP